MELVATHGESGRGKGERSPEYRAWAGMQGRCLFPADKRFPNYGGRGIRICDRWLGKGGFARFVADVGRKPTKDHSLDRIDVNGNYEPGNCRWATREQQDSNKRTNHKITFLCLTRTLAQWGRIYGVPQSTLRLRLGRGTPFYVAIHYPASPEAAARNPRRAAAGSFPLSAAPTPERSLSAQTPAAAEV